MNTKLVIIPVIIGVSLILATIFLSMSEEPQMDSVKKVGIVEGTVQFIGKPCSTSQLVPPCNGPYPNYEVVIYDIDGTLADKITTDDKGNFETKLPIGDYLVYGQNFDFNKVIEIPIEFTVESERKKSIEILINTGIR